MKIFLETCSRGKPAFAVIVLTFIPWTGTAFAGTLKGQVKPSKEFTEFVTKHAEETLREKEDYYWMVENGVLPIKPPVVNWSADITVALMKESGMPGAGKIQNVLIKGAGISPSIIVVPPRTTVRFTNEDPFLHSIYSPDMGPSFSPEILPSRQLRQVQFLNPGVYSIRCKMTPHIEGYVIVDPFVVETVSPGKDGAFVFENVPPGKYMIRIYYKAGEVGSIEEVEVSDVKPVEVEIEAGDPGKAREELREAEKEGGESEAGKPAPEGKAGEKPAEEKVSGKGAGAKKGPPSKGK